MKKPARTRTTQWVVVYGDLRSGINRIVGPFATADEGRDWAIDEAEHRVDSEPAGWWVLDKMEAP